jgi:hypothetical protein
MHDGLTFNVPHSAPCSTLQQHSAPPSRLYQLELFEIIVHATRHSAIDICLMMHFVQCHWNGRVTFWDWPTRELPIQTIEYAHVGLTGHRLHIPIASFPCLQTQLATLICRCSSSGGIPIGCIVDVPDMVAVCPSC